MYGKKIMTILAIGDHEISLQAACPETSIALTNIIERKIKFYQFKSKWYKLEIYLIYMYI